MFGGINKFEAETYNLIADYINPKILEKYRINTEVEIVRIKKKRRRKKRMKEKQSKNTLKNMMTRPIKKVSQKD